MSKPMHQLSDQNVLDWTDVSNAARYCLIESEVRLLCTRPWLTLKTITVYIHLDLPSFNIRPDYIIVSYHQLLSIDKGFEFHIELLLFRCKSCFWINWTYQCHVKAYQKYYCKVFHIPNILFNTLYQKYYLTVSNNHSSKQTWTFTISTSSSTTKLNISLISIWIFIVVSR